MNVIIKYGADLTNFEQGTDSVDQSIKNTTKSANEFSKTLSSGINNIAIGSMAKQFDALDKSIKEVSKDGKITAKELADIKKQANDVGKELGGAVKKGDLLKLAKDAETTTKQFTSLKAELRFLERQITSGELQGKNLEIATERAAHLKDEIGDLSTKLKTLGSDTRVFDTMVEGARLATGAFSIAQGAMALFGNENEDLQKALIKLNAVMAISQGLQEIYTLKQKETAIGRVFDTAATWAQTAAQTAYTFVVGTSTGALKLFRIALASTGVGLLVLAIGLLIANFDKIKKAITENSEGFQNFKKILLFISPPLFLIIEAIQFLQRNLDKIKASITGFGFAIKSAFDGIGNLLGNLLSGNFKGVVQAWNKLGTDAGNAYIEGTQKAIKDKQAALYNDLINATIEFNDRRIKLLEAQGKDTTNLTKENLEDRIRVLSKSLTDEQALEYTAIKNAEKKLKTGEQLNEKEIESLKNKSKEVSALIEAEDALLIFKAQKQKEADDEARKKAEERAKEYARLQKERKEKELKEEQDILEAYINDVEELNKKIEDELKKGLDVNLNKIEINGKIPDSEITKVTKEFAREYLKKIRNEIGAGDDYLSELMRKQIDNASNMIDDGNLQGAFKNLFTGITNIYDSLDEKGKKKITGIISGALEMAQGITNILDSVLEKQIANLDKLIDKQQERVNKASDIAEKGNAVLLEAEETKLQRLEEMRKKQGEKQKALAIVQAIINTALGVTNAFATAPTIVAGIILAAITAAAGAVQIGLIASQTFAKGGYTGNGLMSADETGERPVGIVHEKEFVFDRHTTAKNRNIFEYIHKNKINLNDMFKANRLGNFGGITIDKSIELNELKNEISELKQIMRGLPERMPRTSVAFDSKGFAMSVGQAMNEQSLIKNNIHA
jgi:predicted  nucleic acid-binding Zn-ribbon protein